jgi:hypothetical protein
MKPATTGLLYQPRMIGGGDCGRIGGMKIGRGNRSTRRKPVPGPLLSTTYSIWLDPVLNPGRRGENPATNGLNYGAAFIETYSSLRVYQNLLRHLYSDHPLNWTWRRFLFQVT